MRIAKDIVPSLTGTRTQASLNDPGITYNQAGVTYNDSRYTYGGVYGFTAVTPLVSLATSPIPRIAYSADIYTNKGAAPTTNLVFGPGFFLYITQ